MDPINTYDLRLPVSTTMPDGWLDELDQESLRSILVNAGRQPGQGPLRLLKRSLDLRGRHEPRWQLRIEERGVTERAYQPWRPNDREAKAAPVIIVGAGPAGTFAALQLVEAGYSPIIIDRGQAVQPRRKSLADLTVRGCLVSQSIFDPTNSLCGAAGWLHTVR